jgi:hypothetical protein
MKPCSACDASGLIAISAEDDSGNTCEGSDAETFHGFTGDAAIMATMAMVVTEEVKRPVPI